MGHASFCKVIPLFSWLFSLSIGYFGGSILLPERPDERLHGLGGFLHAQHAGVHRQVIAGAVTPDLPGMVVIVDPAVPVCLSHQQGGLFLGQIVPLLNAADSQAQVCPAEDP